jgi:hypothetical protein
MKLDDVHAAEIPPGQDYENEQACATGQQKSTQRTKQDSSSSAFQIIEIPAIEADSDYGKCDDSPWYSKEHSVDCAVICADLQPNDDFGAQTRVVETPSRDRGPNPPKRE